MNTTVLEVKIPTEYLSSFQSFLEKIKGKSKIINEKKDDAKMSKEDFFAMIDQSKASKKTKITLEDFENKYLK